jgi:hypothetical protein
MTETTRRRIKLDKENNIIIFSTLKGWTKAPNSI